MRLTLFVKILGMIFVSVAFVAGGNFLTNRYFLTQTINQQDQHDVEERADLVQSNFDKQKAQLVSLAHLMAANEDFAEKLAQGDSKWLQSFSKTVIKETGLESITIADTKGVCVGRGHSDKVGDNVGNQVNVQKALKGEISVGVEAGTVVKFSLRAGYPVRLKGEIVGSVTPGFTLSADTFVDQVKKDLNLECTIFQGDTRVSTTIMKEGKRAVGTKLDNPVIVDTVLTKGKRYIGRNKIFGSEYDTAYWPIIDAHGKIAGMFFIGKKRDFIDKVLTETMWSNLASTFVVGLIMMIVGFIFCKVLVNPIKKNIAFANEVAAGNLDGSLDVRREDEIGALADSLRKMVGTLKEKIGEAEANTCKAAEESQKAQEATMAALRAKEEAERAKLEGMLTAAGRIEGIVERITASSEELSAQAEEISKGSELQKGSVQEVASAMEEMCATIIEVARSAEDAARSAEEAKHKAEEGARTVEQVNASIVAVQSQAQTMKGNLSELGKQAENIGRVIDVITDIADQTNLLALNAAIEAARAGEAGRGFAVVADEVRKLAEKTMGATKEVGDSIRAIQDATRRNIRDMEKASTDITKATDLSSGSGGALREIVSLSDSNNIQVQRIATGSREQTQAAEGINHSVGEVHRVANDIAEGMHQSAMAISELAEMASALRKLVDELKAG
jgi:methyl-accepting chemotaxis protein